MRIALLFINFFLFPFDTDINCLNCSSNNSYSVLVITETKGWVHDSIESGLKLIQNIGNKNNFNVYHSDNSSVITYKNLKEIKTIIFLNTTEEILTDVEQKVMESFIKSGKGFVGVHAAADTEYNWQWYGKLVGAYYRNHPEVMNGKILTINHKITNHLDSEWEIEDEWYNFDYVNYDINILLHLDEDSYIGGEHPDYHPITWYHEYDGGRSFYTGLGHTKEVYDDERFIKLLEKGILYASYEDY
ncbi:ThuA domain-containing protein [Flavobacteriaceae bacterium]|nr:ThuA domain-containing protein [Flavobacteriaceae bacterium]